MTGQTALDADFRVGDWLVRPQRDCIQRGAEIVRLAPKAMSVLCCLAGARGETVSRRELFETVWPDAVVTDDALTQRIVEIRKAFGDSARDSEVIETIPKIGFRLIPPVLSPCLASEAQTRQSHAAPTRFLPRRLQVLSGIGAIAMIGAGVWLAGAPIGQQSQQPAQADNPASGEGSMPAQLHPSLRPFARSIAVLPFHDISADHDDLFLADAIHDEVITRLARIPSLRVIAPTSVERYRRANTDLAAIAEKLDVDTLLTGSVQRIGDTVRVHAQLSDMEADKLIWGKSFDRAVRSNGTLSLQTEIADSVAQAMLLPDQPQATIRIGAAPTVNEEAYLSLLRGDVALKDNHRASFDEAIANYKHALELSPTFVQAYLSLARAYTMGPERFSIPEAEAHDWIETYARAALELDPGAGLAYNYIAVVRRETGKLTEAEALFRRALDLEPGSPRILHGLGLTLRLMGKADQAIPYYDRAIRIDPLNPGINESLGSLLRDLGRFEEAERQYRATLEIDPGYAQTHWALGTLYWAMGRPDEAVVWFENASMRAPESDVFRSLAALMYLELGVDDRARAVLDAWRPPADADDHDDTALIAEIYRLYHGMPTDDLPDGRVFMARYWYGGLLDLPVRHLLDGDYNAALQEYQLRFPEVADGQADISGANYRAAIYLSFALSRLGKHSRARELLDAVEAFLPKLHRLGLHGYWVADAQIMAIRGDRTLAVDLLRSAVDEGWRNLWRFYLLHDPVISMLSAEPGYAEIVHLVSDDMRARSSASFPTIERGTAD